MSWIPRERERENRRSYSSAFQNLLLFFFSFASSDCVSSVLTGEGAVEKEENYFLF